ncbi:MAG: response regulator receiver protein [Bacteroidetes bacterium]|nr:response regulator receiver protein [Bacteroidota bacterium]
MTRPLKVLLADDDEDDRFFFDIVLKELSIATQLATVENGEKLMRFLAENPDQLPDVLFLDLNMPRKNGSECLAEIKSNKRFKDLPVFIYSTSMHEDVADLLYNNGAHCYIRKTDIIELQQVLEYALGMMIKNNFKRPARNKFILKMTEPV